MTAQINGVCERKGGSEEKGVKPGSTKEVWTVWWYYSAQPAAVSVLLNE